MRTGVRRVLTLGTENRSDKSAAVGPSSNPHGFMPRRPAPRHPAIAHSRVSAAELAAWRAKAAVAPEPGAQERDKTSVVKITDNYHQRVHRRERPAGVAASGEAAAEQAVPHPQGERRTAQQSHCVDRTKRK